MKILLAIDASDASRAAITYAACRKWSAGSIHLVHVVEPSHLWELATTAKEVTRNAQELVRGAVERLSSTGLEVSGVVLSGDPKRVLLDHATAIGADLILLGSHGRSAVAHLFLGSVASTVLRHASCSVEIIRSANASKKVLLATDGSDAANAAARSISSSCAGAEVRVLSVVELILPTLQAFLEPPFIESEQVEQLRAEAMNHAEQSIASAREILSSACPNVTESISVLLGGPAKIIVQEAKDWGADLVVVGSHGRHGLDRFLMGSVSEAVATHAHCSVRVVRKLAERPFKPE